MELALIENDRGRLRSETAAQETNLAQRAIQKRSEPQMPELIARTEQLIRIDLELARLGSERRAKFAQKRALDERLAKLEEMSTQIRSRPLFQVFEQNLAPVFVPYSQIDGVRAGADVYACVWGLFLCKQVGSVSELLAGEVTEPDAWGTPTRGQYASLELHDPASARNRTLRVRAWDQGTPKAEKQVQARD
jgi:hypothetical protein